MRIAAFAAAVLLSAAAAAAKPRAAEKSAPRSSMPDIAFEFAAPASWSRQSGSENSVVLLGPRDANEISAMISVRHHPAGGKEFADLDAFAARQTEPPLFASSPKTEPLPGVSVAGSPARRFARDSSEFVPPSARNTKEVPMREEIVAFPGKSGFFVVVYRAPKSLFPKHRSALEKVLKSFRAKR